LTCPTRRNPENHGKGEREEIMAVNASILAVPPSGVFDFESLKTGYAGVKIG
jgi:hypothetical protein